MKNMRVVEESEEVGMSEREKNGMLQKDAAAFSKAETMSPEAEGRDKLTEEAKSFGVEDSLGTEEEGSKVTIRRK